MRTIAVRTSSAVPVSSEVSQVIWPEHCLSGTSVQLSLGLLLSPSTAVTRLLLSDTSLFDKQLSHLAAIVPVCL